MSFNTAREAYDAYSAVIDAMNPSSCSSKPGTERDAALLPLSCIPMLAMTNGGYSYPVYISSNPDPGPYHGKPVLHIIGTPGHWFLFSLLERGGKFPNGIAIDFGQNWYCTNFQEVLDAVLEVLA